MLGTFFVSYDAQHSARIKEIFDKDFKQADKIILSVILVFCAVVATVTPWQNGYFVLGIAGGLFVGATCLTIYLLLPGSVLSRCVMGTALTALLAITVQQSNGLGEGHFIFFLGFTMLIRYRDLTPILAYVGTTVVHHFSLTYCQSIGVEWFDQPVLIFSWADQTSWGLLAPLAYHVTFAVLALLISAFFVYEGNKQFLESHAVIDVIEQASTGDLTQRVNVQLNSALIVKVNDFFIRMNQMLLKVSEVTSSVTEQAIKTNQAASDRFARSDKQQHEISLVATAITQMAAATQEIASHAEFTAAALDNADTLSDKGGQLAEHCKQSIDQLAKQVDKAADIVSQLEQSSSQISTIVATIGSIAEQTNLLALNAAIEAARAGEQGRGFAVVADEVRVLSQRTHISTEEISAMISTFQSTINSAVSTMSECHDLASESVDVATNTSVSFEQIATEIKAISDMAVQIATAAEQQTSVTSEVNKNTEIINELSAESKFESQQGVEGGKKLEQQSLSMQQLLKQFSLH